nr:FAD:protein FMN transferase ApbE [Biostraticola tofi]
MSKPLAILACIALLISGCDETPSQKTDDTWLAEGKTMGTFYRVKLAGPPQQALIGLKQKIEQQLAQDNFELSTYQHDTLISQFNRYQGNTPQAITTGMADIITLALRIGHLTGGAMDITVGPLVNLWGFGPDKQPGTMPAQQQIDEARRRIGLRHLKVIQTAEGQWLQKDLPDLYVDLSTMGEGYAADHLASLMEKQGITRYLVSVGGAVKVQGMSPGGVPWRVAIQKPTDEKLDAQAIVDLKGHGISTSGSYRNYYEMDGKRLSHIINPETGRPIEHKLVSVTVISPTALEADGWDTGLMVLGTEKAQKLALEQSLAVYMITKTDQGFRSWMSPQFRSFLLSDNSVQALEHP